MLQLESYGLFAPITQAGSTSQEAYESRFSLFADCSAVA